MHRKNREFRRRQREGEILVSNLSKQTFEVRYTRGIVVNGNVLRNIGYKDGNVPIVKSGDIFVSGGETIRIASTPSHWFNYGLVEAMTDIHPFDVGWVRHTALLPPFEFNTRMITSTLADAESGTYDLLTELAELPDTMSFLADTVKKGTVKVNKHYQDVKRYYKLLKTATGKFAEKVAKKLASSWLAFRYAIMPFYVRSMTLKSHLSLTKECLQNLKAKKSVR